MKLFALSLLAATSVVVGAAAPIASASEELSNEPTEPTHSDATVQCDGTGGWGQFQCRTLIKACLQHGLQVEVWTDGVTVDSVTCKPKGG